TMTFTDLTPIETLTILPIVVLIIVMGIYPQPFLNKIEPTAQQQLAAVASQVHIADNSLDNNRDIQDKN
ncbi:MAG: hypothetical protein KJP19_08720, partial [Deltaproteobacteria bacterium]|nr:hypothetical protein [Deltaproteobacteria bacterium]